MRGAVAHTSPHAHLPQTIFFIIDIPFPTKSTRTDKASMYDAEARVSHRSILQSHRDHVRDSKKKGKTNHGVCMMHESETNSIARV